MKDIIFLLTGIAAAVAVGFAFEDKKIKENFGNIPAQTYKRMPEAKIENRYGAAVFSVPPNWQGNLPPRFSNTGYGAYILYNIPDEENLAVPKFPLTYAGNVRESYQGIANGQTQGCPSAGANSALSSGTMPSSVSQFAANAAEGKFETGQEALPGGTQIYNYDRLVYAQKKSRLHGLGDPIRGDIPVVPIQDQWFRPSVYPNIDLRQGAITTISGHDNATSNQLRALQADFSGKTALAQKDISFDGRQADIFVTAFP